jgi:AraC-like DNA-binding protein
MGMMKILRHTAVGLRAPTYFAEMFLRHTGQTPSQYRALHANHPQNKSDN